MAKHNININRPNWQHVIENLEMSDRMISKRLDQVGIEYSVPSVHRLRNGNISSPGYEIGRELLNLLAETNGKKPGKKADVIAKSRTRA